MNLIESGRKTIKAMDPFDVGLFKTYLLVVGLLAASLCSWFGMISPLVYLGIAVLGVIYLLPKIFGAKKKKGTGFFASKMQAFHSLSMLDISVFKITHVSLGLMLYFLVPWFQTIDQSRYIGIFLFCLGWIISLWVRQCDCEW